MSSISSPHPLQQEARPPIMVGGGEGGGKRTDDISDQ